ncbi:MAG: hypothetical protein AAF304_00060 [Pseudomonadota bacterium]
MIQKLPIVKLLIAIFVFLIIYVIGWKIYINLCGWLHSSPIYCYFIPDPAEAGSIVGGAIFGWKQKLSVSMYGFIVPIVGLSFTLLLDLTSTIYGDVIWPNLIPIYLSSIVFGFLSSVAFSALSNKYAN